MQTEPILPFSSKEIFTFHSTDANSQSLMNKAAKLYVQKLLPQHELYLGLPKNAQFLFERLRVVQEKREQRKALHNREVQKIRRWEKASSTFKFSGLVLTVGALALNLIPSTRAISRSSQLIPGIIMIAKGAMQDYSNGRKSKLSDTFYGQKKYALTNERVAILVELEPFIIGKIPPQPFPAKEIFASLCTPTNKLNLANKAAKWRVNMILADEELCKQLPPKAQTLVDRLRLIQIKREAKKARRERELKSIQTWQTAANIFDFTGLFLSAGAFVLSILPSTRAVSQLALQVPGIVMIAQGAFQGYIGDRKRIASDTTYGNDKHSLANERAAILVHLDPYIEQVRESRQEEY